MIQNGISILVGKKSRRQKKDWKNPATSPFMNIHIINLILNIWRFICAWDERRWSYGRSDRRRRRRQSYRIDPTKTVMITTMAILIIIIVFITFTIVIQEIMTTAIIGINAVYTFYIVSKNSFLSLQPSRIVEHSVLSPTIHRFLLPHPFGCFFQRPSTGENRTPRRTPSPCSSASLFSRREFVLHGYQDDCPCLYLLQ